jgi:hypothetical protein
MPNTALKQEKPPKNYVQWCKDLAETDKIEEERRLKKEQASNSIIA